jgi:hypothetical protein
MIATKRNLLKLDLLSERAQYIPGKGEYPICPICNEPIREGADMHEAIITRGMVNGNKDEEKIYSCYNCVLRHSVCPNGQSHTPGIGSEITFEKCLTQICHFEGKDNILLWLSEMENFFPIVAKQAKLRVQSVLNSNLEKP